MYSSGRFGEVPMDLEEPVREGFGARIGAAVVAGGMQVGRAGAASAPMRAGAVAEAGSGRGGLGL